MSSPWWLVLLVVGVLFAGGMAPLALQAIAAARARAKRRSDCPFEDDDDLPRPWSREARDVVVECATLVRLWTAIAPGAWRRPGAGVGRGPIVVLVPERRFRAAALRTLGRRLARDLDATIQLAPAPVAAGGPHAVDRLSDLLRALAGTDPARPVLVIGHGRGGRTARAAAARLRAPVGVVTLATDHRPDADGHDPPAAGDGLLSVYSLHDAQIVPPGRAYVAGAMNVAMRDVGHYEMAVSRRVYQVVLELLAPSLASDAARRIAS